MLKHRRQNWARLTRLATPQVERNPGTRFVARATDVPAWPTNEWERFDRFLIFGDQRGVHYLRARKPALEHVADVRACIAADGPRAVRRIVEVSALGRVVSNEPSIAALALCAALGNAATRTMALEAVPEIARSCDEPARFRQYLASLRGRLPNVRRTRHRGCDYEATA